MEDSKYIINVAYNLCNKEKIIILKECLEREHSIIELSKLFSFSYTMTWKCVNELVILGLLDRHIKKHSIGKTVLVVANREKIKGVMKNVDICIDRIVGGILN